MSDLPNVHILETDLTVLPGREGVIAAFATPEGKLDQGARKISTLTKKTLGRAV